MSYRQKIDDPLRIRASNDGYVGADGMVALHIFSRVASAKAIDFEPRTEGMHIPAACYIANHEAQQLMDDLWACGLRPAAGRHSEGVTAAQDRHLQDMRAIAFAKLEIERP